MNVFACFLCKPNIEVLFGLLWANPDKLHATYHATDGEKLTLVSGAENSEQELDRSEVA